MRHGRAATLKTAIHEVAHARLYERKEPSCEDKQPDKATREVQAESVAYAVCQYWGLTVRLFLWLYRKLEFRQGFERIAGVP